MPQTQTETSGTYARATAPGTPESPKPLTLEEFLTPKILSQLKTQARRVLLVPEEADEIVQETLLNAFLIWERVWPENPTGWLVGLLKIEIKKFHTKHFTERQNLTTDSDQILQLKFSYPQNDEPLFARRELELLEQAREILGVDSSYTVTEMLDLVETRDPGRGQQVKTIQTKSCKNGHPRNTANTRYARDGTVRCLACSRERRAAKV